MKVLHRKVPDRPETAELNLTLARSVAKLDHLHTVPAHEHSCSIALLRRFEVHRLLTYEEPHSRPWRSRPRGIS